MFNCNAPQVSSQSFSPTIASIAWCPPLFQEKDDGTAGDLMIRQSHNDQSTIQATDHYAQRVSMDDKGSLLISQASLKDQKTFTCMVVSESNLMEYPVSVSVYSKLTATSTKKCSTLRETHFLRRIYLVMMVASPMKTRRSHVYSG